MDLAGQVALVTGGSRGIGFAIARGLLRSGMRVAITATSVDGATRAAASLRSDAVGADVLPLAVDVRHRDEIVLALDAVVERFGGLDILVNNAGVGLRKPVAETNVEDWSRVIDTNLTGVFNVCHAGLPLLKQRGAGWIVNISSLASRGPFANGAAYCASKAAINAFTESLMQEVRYDGIRVACVLPGSVQTGFGGHDGPGIEQPLMPDDVAEAVTALLAHPPRSLPSRVEIRPAQPRKS